MAQDPDPLHRQLDDAGRDFLEYVSLACGSGDCRRIRDEVRGGEHQQCWRPVGHGVCLVYLGTSEHGLFLSFFFVPEILFILTTICHGCCDLI